MSRSPTYKQDLPPPGGYKPIPFLRVPAKQYMSGVTMFILYNVITFGAFYLWSFTEKKFQNLKTEDRSARLAIQPMIFAEKDRLFMKRYRQLRDEEEELMKDVPGWVVGTYWGEPIYHTRDPDEWHEISPREYWSHNPDYKFNFFKNFYKYL